MGKCVGSGNLVKNIKCTMKDTFANNFIEFETQTASNYD
jgi:hypothetical protein